MKKCTVITLVLLLLIGCSDKEPDQQNAAPDTTPTEEVSNKEEGSAKETDPDQDSNQTEDNWIDWFEEAPEVTISPEYLANQAQGPYAEYSFLKETEEFEELFEGMHGIPADATEEELDQVFNYIVSQVSVDLTDPQTIVDSWKIGSYGNPELEDSRYHFKENYNIEILIDSSGSMANLANGKTRMEVAKEAIRQFLKDAPENANVALRVYGHKGTGSDADKELSCKSSEMVYSFDSYDETKFTKALNAFEPAGWTPLAQSMIQAKDDMKNFDGKTNTNMIYVVSDGIETCDGNPVEAAKSFSESNIKPIINIIGFDVDGDGQKQLKEMAEQANGTYTNVYNSEQLSSEFEKAQDALEEWEKWKENAEYQAGKDSDRRYLDTNYLENEYVNTLARQKNNTFFIIGKLEDLGLITAEQKNYLDAKRIEIEEQMEESISSMMKDLEALDAKTLEETKKQIQEKYNQNTN